MAIFSQNKCNLANFQVMKSILINKRASYQTTLFLAIWHLSSALDAQQFPDSRPHQIQRCRYHG